MELPDTALRVEYIATLNEIKLMLEQRQIEAQACIDSVRERYSLDDDDLAFKAEIALSEEMVRWEFERDMLAREHRLIINCIAASQRYATETAEHPGPYFPDEYRAEVSPTQIFLTQRRRKTAHSSVMGKKRKLLVAAHQRNQCARTSDTRAEIALRRVEEQEEIARSTAELETQWESEAWNAAVDAAFRDVSPGPPLFCDFLAKNFPDSAVPADDSMSMDLGYESSDAGSSNDDGIEQHWSQRPIVCERSGDAEQVSQDWAALNLMLGTTRQMGPGDRQSNLDDVHPFVRRSLELGHPHPSRAPSHAHATKTKLLTLHEEFITDRTAAPGVDLDSMSSAGYDGEPALLGTAGGSEQEDWRSTI
ncbi:hypothetical protein C8R43DRAFT_1125397 [Mycena crocata]|nr:hypothetical protein C8R43DRAFT_1125397 [Mycena crocata]